MRTATGTGTERWHGTAGGYTNHGCGCGDCREARNVQQRAARRRRSELREAGFTDFTHGSVGYTEWGCRCDVCTAANTARAVGRRARQKSSREKELTDA